MANVSQEMVLGERFGIVALSSIQNRASYFTGEPYAMLWQSLLRLRGSFCEPRTSKNHVNDLGGNTGWPFARGRLVGR